MYIREGFLVRKIIDDYIVVPTGDNIVDFAATISLNESGAFLWNKLQSDCSEANLVEALLQEYEGLDEETAKHDVADFVALLQEHKLLCE